jgi:hypothetical protein
MRRHPSNAIELFDTDNASASARVKTHPEVDGVKISAGWLPKSLKATSKTHFVPALKNGVS